MRRIRKLIMLVAIAGFLMACGNSTTTSEANYQVIPLPQEINTTEGQPFELAATTKVVYREGNELMERNAQF